MKVGSVLLSNVLKAGRMDADFFIGDGAERRLAKAEMRVKTAERAVEKARAEIAARDAERARLGIEVARDQTPVGQKRR